MTNREYAIKKINEVLERVDDTRLKAVLRRYKRYDDNRSKTAKTRKP